MSFAPAYTSRFANVVEPAIRTLTVKGIALRAHRVDVSQSGDSILTEIVDGIAHARLILADVSSIGKDSVSGAPYRNANVMYEVGVALASRQPQDVLLIRDDHDRFLFDVSAIPHLTLDFTAKDAVDVLAAALQARLREQTLVEDARVRIAISTLTNAEADILKALSELAPNMAMSFELGGFNAHVQQGLARLLDKGLISPHGKAKEKPAYALTSFGYAAVTAAGSLLPSKANINTREPEQEGAKEDVSPV